MIGKTPNGVIRLDGYRCSILVMMIDTIYRSLSR